MRWQKGPFYSGDVGDFWHPILNIRYILDIAGENRQFRHNCRNVFRHYRQPSGQNGQSPRGHFWHPIQIARGLRFFAIACISGLKCENLLWSMFYWHQDYHGSIMTPLRFLLAFVFLGTRSFFQKSLEGTWTFPSCLGCGKVWTNSMGAFWKYSKTKF